MDNYLHNIDCWPGNLIRLKEGAISSISTRYVDVVYPEGIDDIIDIIKMCRENGLAIVPYGGGSGVIDGLSGKTRSIVLDLKCMNRIVLDEGTRVVYAGAGVIGSHLDRFLAQRGFTLGHYPSSIMCSTVGGWLATRGAGQLSSYYGKIEDMVEMIEFVDGTGKIHQLTPTDDLFYAVIGSEGGLGVITKAAFKIKKKANYFKIAGFTFNSIESAINAMQSIMQSGLRPSVLRLYDELDTLIALGGSDDSFAGKKETKIKEILERQALRIILNKPKIISNIFDSFLKRCLMIIGFEGHNEKSTEERFNLAKRLLKRENGHYEGTDPGSRWLKKRYSVSFKQTKIYKAGGFVDTMEVAISWDKLYDLYKKVKEELSDLCLVMAHFSHAYIDGCSIYFTFSAAFREEQTLKFYRTIWDRAMKVVIELGGTISHHHGIGAHKRAYIAKEQGELSSLYRRLKLRFDPDRIFNPARLLFEP